MSRGNEGLVTDDNRQMMLLLGAVPAVVGVILALCCMLVALLAFVAINLPLVVVYAFVGAYVGID